MDNGSALTRRHLLRMASALAGGSLLAACGGGAVAPAASSPSAAAASGSAAATAGAESVASLEAAAKAEGGQITWYMAGNPALVDSVSKGFQAAYPWVRFQGVSVPLAEITTKAVTEKITNAPGADVVWTPSPQRQNWLKNDLVESVKLANESQLPAAAVDPEGYSHPVWQLLIVPQYNTDLGVKVPKDAFDFADPSWKGKLAFDRVQNLGQSAVWLSVWRKKWGDAKWQQWLDGLAKNDVLLTPNAGSAHDVVQHGERQIGLASTNYVLAQAKGAPVAMDFGIQPVPSFIEDAYLMKRAKSPRGARLFMNWSVSKAGQQACAAVGLTPMVSGMDVPSDLSKILPKGVEPASPGDLADFTKNVDDYLKHLSARFPG